MAATNRALHYVFVLRFLGFNHRLPLVVCCYSNNGLPQVRLDQPRRLK